MNGGVRSRVCLQCRTLFDAGEDCRGKNHRTVALRTAGGRSSLDDEVWGPDSRARAVRQAAKAGAGGATAGASFDWCNGCDPGLADCGGSGAGGEAILGAIVGILVILVAAALGMLLYWLIRALVRWIREKMHVAKPHGALFAAPKPKQAVTVARGVVQGGNALALPWAEGSAYAWAFELHKQQVFGGGAMMRDARTAGFDVALEDGRTLRVPPGRIRALGRLARSAADREKVDAFVGDVDLTRGENKTVFPYDFTRTLTVEAGDRIELLGDMKESAEESGAGGYRTSAGIVVPVGVPHFHVHKAPRARIAAAELPEATGGTDAYAELPTEEDAAGASPPSRARRP